MQKKISNLPFRGTKEQEERLKAVIAENCHDKSNVMVVMQKAQDIYGYLPIEVQEMIAEGKITYEIVKEESELETVKEPEPGDISFFDELPSERSAGRRQEMEAELVR